MYVVSVCARVCARARGRPAARRGSPWAGRANERAHSARELLTGAAQPLAGDRGRDPGLQAAQAAPGAGMRRGLFGGGVGVGGCGVTS